MLKLKNDACVAMPLVVVGCTSAVCHCAREATTRSGADNELPPTGRHR